MYGFIKISKKTSNALKAFGMLSVLTLHIYDLVDPDVMLSAHLPIRWFCRIGMSVFMFLSGYGVSESYRIVGLDGYWDKRIKKIYIPMVIANAISLIIGLSLGIPYTRKSAFVGLLSVTGENTVNSPTWYIPFLFSFYFLFYVVWYFVKSEKRRAICLIIATLLFWYVVPSVFPGAFFFSFSFTAGVLMSANGERLIEHSEYTYTGRILWGGAAVALFILCFGGIIVLNGQFVSNARINGVLDNLMILLCTFAFITLVKEFEKHAIIVVMERIGKISFSFYLLHYSICILPIQEGICGYFWLFMLIPLTVACSILFTRICIHQ